jgi:hypothetical protein
MSSSVFPPEFTRLYEDRFPAAYNGEGLRKSWFQHSIRRYI